MRLSRQLHEGVGGRFDLLVLRALKDSGFVISTRVGFTQTPGTVVTSHPGDPDKAIVTQRWGGSVSDDTWRTWSKKVIESLRAKLGGGLSFSFDGKRVAVERE